VSKSPGLCNSKRRTKSRTRRRTGARRRRRTRMFASVLKIPRTVQNAKKRTAQERDGRGRAVVPSAADARAEEHGTHQHNREAAAAQSHAGRRCALSRHSARSSTWKPLAMKPRSSESASPGARTRSARGRVEHRKRRRRRRIEQKKGKESQLLRTEPGVVYQSK
jgi:hypothetical protein